MKITYLLMILLGLPAFAESEAVYPMSCKIITLNQHQDDLSALLDFKVDNCENSSNASGMVPSVKIEKFKAVSGERSAVIYNNKLKQENQFFDKQKVIYHSTQFIPECENFSNSWRLQIGAITDSNVVANELFFNLLKDLVLQKELHGIDLQNWQICKSFGEEFGQEKSAGDNITARLYLQKITDAPIKGTISSTPRQNLASSCIEQVEKSSLFMKLTNLMPKVQQAILDRIESGILEEERPDINADAARMWIIPPQDYVNRFFTVSHNKYQFGSCSTLESSPSLKAKK